MNSSRNSSSRRHQSRRRWLSDLGLTVGVLGVICILFAGAFAVSAWFFAHSGQKNQLRLSLLYLGAGIVMLGARGLTGLVRNKISRNRDRRPRYREVNEPSRDSGSVLILTLIVLALVVALVMQSQWATRVALRQAEIGQATTRLRLAAADAARHALMDLAQDEDLTVDSTNDAWAATRDVRNPEGVNTHVVITDENRYFDLNNLAVPVTGEPIRTASDVVMDMLTLCGDFAPVDRVEALADWIDADNQGYREADFYHDRQRPVRPPNRVAQSWGELLRVDGFTRDLFRRHERRALHESFSADLVDCLTVVSFPRNRPVPVNLNTASREVLMGLFGLNHEQLVNTIVSRRMAAPLRSLEPLALLLDPLLMDSLIPFLDLKSQFFRVEARSFYQGQAVNLRAVVHRNPDGQVKILQWVI